MVALTRLEELDSSTHISNTFFARVQRAFKLVPGENIMERKKRKREGRETEKGRREKRWRIAAGKKK